MPPAEQKTEVAPSAEKSPEVVQSPLSQQQETIKLLRSNVLLLYKGVTGSDVRLLHRVLRQLNTMRKKITAPVLRAIAQQYRKELLPQIPANRNKADGGAMDTSSDSSSTFPEEVEEDLSVEGISALLAQHLKSLEEKDAADVTKDTSSEAKDKAVKEEVKEVKAVEAVIGTFPELEVYLDLLLSLYLFDRGLLDEAAQVIDRLYTTIQTNAYNRRSLDLLSGKVYFYYSYIHEKLSQDQQVRNSLLTAHRTSCLRQDDASQAVLSNAILRNYLSSNLYHQADTFRVKSSFPEQHSNAQTARYCYYTGKIQAIQLNYSDAFASLTTALRKAPQKAALGFRQVCTKLLILVSLLMGDIPERALFSTDDLRRSLKPYLQLTQAVRIGDLSLFSRVMAEHRPAFEKDGTYSLIVRLRSNVIKAGLRKINLAYSKISISDICKKLALESEEDAESMVVKAIADGVIEATVDRQNKVLLSKDIQDVYSSNEPQAAFHKRIQFTLDIHQQAVKALRYPPNAHKAHNHDDWSDEEDEDTIAGNPPDKREEDNKKKD